MCVLFCYYDVVNKYIFIVYNFGGEIMKKVKVVLLGLITFICFGILTINNNVVNADTTDNTNATNVPTNVMDAVNELFDNYTNDNITVTDASFSRPTLAATSGTYSINEFFKIPVMKKYVFKGTTMDDASNLQNVKFQYYGHYQNSGDMDYKQWIRLYALYNGETIKTKDISIVDNSRSQTYTVPTDLPGIVEATHEEGAQYAPLIDTENDKSSRSLAPGSDWYTDKFMINREWGFMLYRVSTSEWVDERYIKPHANTDLRIDNDISVGRMNIFNVTYRAISGEPLYKSDGELWNYTLPNNTDWQITAVAFDQYGLAYFQVSNNAWVRANRETPVF